MAAALMVAAGLALLVHAGTAEAQILRTGPGYVVERMDGPGAAPAARSASAAAKPRYRVVFEGRYPPTALRYELRVNGRRIAFARPSANGRHAIARTRDGNVLTERVTLTYGGGPVPTAAKNPAPAAFPKGYAEGRTTFPNGVVRQTYNLGDEAFQPSGITRKVEVAGDVHYPKNFDGAPLPVVVFMHGNHVTCYQERSRFNSPRVRFQWPCKEGFKPIPSYAGYGYLARDLAARGFVVISVSVNGINVHGYQADDTGMRQRGELLDHHLELWKQWSTSADVPGNPYGGRFVGRLDFSRIGTMGHSRGGEGVVWHRIVDAEREEPFGVKAILSLAPVDFTRETVNGSEFAVVLPTCDGDVDDLQGMHMYDDARYNVPGDPTAKFALAVFGANHNAFNRVWMPGDGFGGYDDTKAGCPAPIDGNRQRRLARDYIGGFFRATLGGEGDQRRHWTGASRPRGVLNGQVNTSYTAPDSPSRRLDIGRFTSVDELTLNNQGGAVTPIGLQRFEWCSGFNPNPCVPGLTRRDVHHPGLPQAVVGWTGGAGRLVFELPSGSRDISAFRALQLRTMPNPAYAANAKQPVQEFEILLSDTTGARAKVRSSNVDDSALRQIRSVRGAKDPLMLGQIRFPLSLFAGVDTTSIQRVELRFKRTSSGVLNLADLAFAR